jgi:putative DNA primase/helicase
MLDDKGLASDILEIIQYLLPGAKAIKLRGYSSGNKSYSTAKSPVGKWKSAKSLSASEIDSLSKKGYWIGATIPEGRIVIDVDNSLQGKLVKGLLEAENVNHHCIRTPNGWQFIFEEKPHDKKQVKQITKFFTSIGVVVDTRTAGSGYIVFPTGNTDGRYIATKGHIPLSYLPEYLWPVRNSTTVMDKSSGERYVFPIPIEVAGSRNETLYKFATHLRAWKVDPQEISKAMELIYKYFLLDKTDFPMNELRQLTKSASEWEPQQSEDLETDNCRVQKVIPLPFQIKGNALYKTVKKKIDRSEEESTMVCRILPTPLREISNIERNSVYFELAWNDKGQEKREIVPASTISTKRELLRLADLGLPVNDLNCKDLIQYFDQYIAQNRLQTSYMVERLGAIKDKFIHPLDSERIEIIPTDTGEVQLLEAFKAEGTVETWKKEVFDRIKHHRKVLFLVLSSFASILLKDIKVPPFIVDLSGSTSQGKTTALQVARSVWGNEGLINEWNATKVAIERKAGFLNSFPLILDDTRKTDERILQTIVYQFSGGRSKGRGSLKGSQREATWNNVLISTGEVSLQEYAAKTGGAAARVISLVDQPFENVDYRYFSDLYQAIGANYGVIGMEFLRGWQSEKKALIPEFHKFIEHYRKKSKGNEVLNRLSMYYAAVHFAGSVAQKVIGLKSDFMLLDHLFDEIAQENKELDKPKEFLEQILSDLDSSRRAICYDQYLPDEIKAVYKYDTICLTLAYLKKILGAEEKLIRREWLKKGYTQPAENGGKTVDYKQIKICGNKFRVIVINSNIVKILGFDFTRGE